MRLTRLLDDLLDFCFPGFCAVCRTSCEGKSPLCETCGERLHVLCRASFCPLCALPVAQPNAPCPACKGAGVRNFERIGRLAVFEEPLRTLLHQFKYHRCWTLGEILADRLWELPEIQKTLAECDCLVPVPLHPIRQIVRGYNQAEVIARQLSHHCGLPIARPVVRVRDTPTQTHLHSRAQRTKNLRGAFRLDHPESIEGKTVAVIDDVMTTGATLQTLARALKPAKPATLCAMIIAIADPRGRGFEVI
ncbi:MAG TPA: ComF family protein [Tepidisphaeraceae bacterium]|nr:ComF family protein [Tepidisphaeraceae bacterium]